MLIVHLSDIHFRKSEIETTQDPNHHLRNEIVRDVSEICKRLGPPDVIIVSGDVAFAGDPEEYAFATKWLMDFCARCGTSLTAVFVCPGNHDVDRKTTDRNVVHMLHKSIKDTSEIALDATIRGLLTDKDAARLLYESLANYNAFAQQFLCDLLPPDRTRSCRDLVLNDGSTLRLWGLNTCFVSSSGDKEGDLFVDPASFQITRETGTVNVVVAHHHLSWIRQKQALEDHLNDVAAIQIFGHVHTNRIIMSRDWIRLTASAAHPDRREPAWEPGYNVIELDVIGTGNDRRLNVRSHVRVWQTAPGGFHSKMDKGRDVFEHSIPLDHWVPKAAAQSAATSAGHASLDVPETRPGPNVMSQLREIAVRFYKLSFSKKSEISGRLELLEDEDMNQPDFERFRRVFIRAYERNKLDQLVRAVEELENS